MKAFLLVDIQNDFTSGGALYVPEGDQIVPIVNKLQEKFDLVIATQDWHPKDHQSFAPFHDKNPGDLIDLHGVPQVLWPVHCVQGTHGAEFVAALATEKIKTVFQRKRSKQLLK